MGDTNYFSGIVKVLENPRQVFVTDKISVTKFRAEIPQVRQNKMINLIFWGNLARDVKIYYQLNDYIVIEGYLSRLNKKNLDSKGKTFKNATITVLRVYPFLLKSDHLVSES